MVEASETKPDIVRSVNFEIISEAIKAGEDPAALTPTIAAVDSLRAPEVPAWARRKSKLKFLFGLIGYYLKVFTERGNRGGE